MPTDEQRAFWAAIRAHPDEDTPRLVYADWLQENGDEARAEFIRVQCALAKLPADRRRNRKDRKQWEMREKALLDAHKTLWTESLCRALEGQTPYLQAAEWCKRIRFERGFVGTLYLNFDSALRLIESNLEPEPINWLQIVHAQHSGSHSHSAVAVIGSWKAGSSARVFSLDGATDEDVGAILAGGRLTHLSRLDLWHGSVTDAAVVALAGSPLLASVTSLCLSLNKIGSEGARALADSPYLSPRCGLNLYGNRIDAPVRARLRERFGDALQIEAERP